VIEKYGRVGKENGGMIENEIPASKTNLYVRWKLFKTRAHETK
jgi:hypothetical protein